MNIASSSLGFARQIAAGELSQLEWLDLCAHDLGVDGVSLERAHFPRTDAEYLAQLKKTAVDLGLAIVALADDGVLADGDGATESFALAASLGAPLVIARAPEASDDPAAWPVLVERAKTAARAAKAANVPLAVRNARGTLCEFVDALKRLAKDVDSAWLRFGLDVAAFRSVDDIGAVLARTIVAIETTVPTQPPAERRVGARDVVRALRNFRGRIVVESPESTLEEMREELDALAVARARFALERLTVDSAT
jgi:hypothetical protein